MARPSPRVPDDVLREAARRAIDRSSLRSVARDVGLSATGLDVAVNESGRWKRGTRTKLLDWYLREGANVAHASAGTVAAALDVITEIMTDAEKERARAAILDVVANVHRAAPREPPSWLEELQGKG